MSNHEFPASVLGYLCQWVCAEIYDVRVRWSRRILVGAVVCAAVCAGLCGGGK